MVEAADELLVEAPVIPKEPDIKATTLLRIGGGAAQSRVRFKWVDEKARSSFDGATLVSSGNAQALEFSGWFYPAGGSSFLIIASIAMDSGSTKIHYSGPDWDLIDNKFINYGGANLLGGLGYRHWFSKSKRFSITHYFKAGPGAAFITISGVGEELVLFGGELKAGASIQYHYSPPIIFGGYLEFGYRAYNGSKQQLTDEFNRAAVDVDMGSGYIMFGGLIGYDF